jgi:hypothetical protein
MILDPNRWSVRLMEPEVFDGTKAVQLKHSPRLSILLMTIKNAWLFSSRRYWLFIGNRRYERPGFTGRKV